MLAKWSAHFITQDTVLACIIFARGRLDEKCKCATIYGDGTDQSSLSDLDKVQIRLHDFEEKTQPFSTNFPTDATLQACR